MTMILSMKLISWIIICYAMLCYAMWWLIRVKGLCNSSYPAPHISPPPFPLTSSQFLRPLLRLLHPLLQITFISHPKPNLKRIWIGSQTRLDRITLQSIQNRPILWIPRCFNSECREQPNKCGEEFPVCKMRTCTHTRTGAVRIVWGTASFWAIEVALDGEFVGGFEVHGIIISSPGVLFGC